MISKSVWSCAALQSNEVRINVTRRRVASLQNIQQPAFSVQSQGGQVICNYTLQEDGAIQLIIYDEYQRARASFNTKQHAGTYMHIFNVHLPNGLYIVVLQTNQQKLDSKEIVISN